MLTPQTHFFFRFVTGPKPLVDRVMLHVQVSVLHATSLSQFVVLELLKQWGQEGFFKHVGRIEDFYRERRDAMVAAAEKHLTGFNLYFYIQTQNVWH